MEINLEILYVILGIIYFFYSMWKNFTKKPVTRQEEGGEEEEAEMEPTARQHRRETVSDPFDETGGRPVSRKPSSFEELLQDLEEVSGGADKRAREKVKKVKEAEEEFQPAYEDPNARYTEQEAERRIRETEARKALQEKTSAAERAEAIGNEVNKKLAQTKETIESDSEKPQKRGGIRKVNQRRQQILHMLQDTENLKNVVVASEILRRKDF